MTNEVSAILVIMSRVFDYPDKTFYEKYSSIEEYLKNQVSILEVQKQILRRLKPLFKMPFKDLQELYVETFDYQEKTSLYLTSHELGDSRKRGAALIKLQKMICEAGYENVGKELADYIPMLLELLAVAPESENIIRLKSRLSYAIYRIINHLPSSNPYHKVMEILMEFVFEVPKLEEITLLENQREEADLEPLPYPMIYQ
ncbi:nitrate reductase molybdenum cofactor assembly chaperone [Bacillus sp. FDAARGOS_1420]|uniref:nitrate reductase molybdenum cofactor assembly chaperone n=1 Tax=unclassified Bacillus (in: firmicutes) TaxID=185979 RepID=UPI001C5A65C7|nr:nitrate reductase molybdenum cofactor assembly chaperone [Bacillus sp. FDAARGOS_1420]MBW3496762.1 nitrate reductase molybdenum cofactor assembly chaperone [Bacillus sp. FDAARGOS_1420]